MTAYEGRALRTLARHSVCAEACPVHCRDLWSSEGLRPHAFSDWAGRPKPKLILWWPIPLSGTESLE